MEAIYIAVAMGSNDIDVTLEGYSYLLMGEEKSGKEQPISEPVLTEDGWRCMGDIKVGDKVYGKDGKLHSVSGVFPQGIKDVYKVTFKDGTSTRCGLDHLWKVYTRSQVFLNDKKNRDNCNVLSLKDILKDYKQPYKNGSSKINHKYSIPMNDAIEFENKDVSLDPYVLGLLLGDGGLTSSTMTFTNAEDDLFEELNDVISKYGCELHMRDFENHKQANIVYNGAGNPLKNIIKELGLFGCGSREKFIPKEYIYNSKQVRIDILSGLINTDGSMREFGSATFGTMSEQLWKDTTEVARSLGFMVSTYSIDRMKEDRTKKYEDSVEYSIRITGDLSVLHLSKKHSSKFIARPIELKKTIVDIELVGEEDSQCIMLDSEDHLYITKDYIVTHNTTLFFEVMAKFYGNTSAGQFLPFEKGYGALAQAKFITCLDENKKQKPFIDSWDDLVEITDALVEERFGVFKQVRTLGLDTVDRLYVLAKKEVMDTHARLYPNKPVKSINDAMGGYGKGRDLQKELVYDILQKLRLAGYGIWFLGHTKFKNVKKDGEIEGYDTMGSNLNEDLYKNIAQDMDFIMQIKVTRNKNADGTLANTDRKLILTSDGYYTCGSRFSAFLKPEVPLSADAFLVALDEALIKASGYTRDVLLKSREQQNAEREAAAKLFVKGEVNKKEFKEKVKYIKSKYDILPANIQDILVSKMLEAEVSSIENLADNLGQGDFFKLYDQLLPIIKDIEANK